MMSHKQRILAAMKGEMVDVIPFVPRLDLWWLANSLGGTLPQRYAGMTHDQIARANGWALYKMVPDFASMIKGPEDILHRAIGLYSFRQSVYRWEFGGDVEVRVRGESGQQRIEYHTPRGMVSTLGGLTEEMKRAGASLGWTQEHVIKRPADYEVVGYIFENIDVYPNHEGFLDYANEVGDDGVVAAGGPSLAASPMHHIQKEFLDPTRFFFEYQDNHAAMRGLAERLTPYYEKVLALLADAPVEVVLWGANYDDTLTYPPYFEKEIAPWLSRVAERLGTSGKLVATHTDGENFGLMDLIRDSGVHLAESVTPSPMTKVDIAEYYSRWRDKLTIMGGIPECVLLEETASEAEFEGFVDHLFASVAPGDRLILGVADSVPPNAVFDRLLRLGERIEREARLPLSAGAARTISSGHLQQVAARISPLPRDEERFGSVREAVFNGDREALAARVRQLLEEKVGAQAILERGLIAGMEVIGAQFKNGEIFIPEVLLASRAVNGALELLEPQLAEEKQRDRFRVLIGTVKGDMHDIGKNMVATMLRGVGFEIRDLGINVQSEEFARQVEEYQPHILALSALLTTTMPEMKNVVEALGRSGARERVRVLVGGAPVNQKFAEGIGADGYAADASEAVAVARALVAGFAAS
jgi:methylmalonyl-CoA mutase cobalamin-binding domain/chain